MSVYLDASVIVPLLLADAHSARATALLRASKTAPIISDWAGLEVSNVVARQVRIGALGKDEAAAALENFDLWRGKAAIVAETSAMDVAAATQFVRRFDLTLRGPDALHLAIAQRLGATLCTFDVRMAAAATTLGLMRRRDRWRCPVCQPGFRNSTFAAPYPRSSSTSKPGVSGASSVPHSNTISAPGVIQPPPRSFASAASPRPFP